MRANLVGALLSATVGSTAFGGWIVENRQGRAECSTLSPTVGWSGLQAFSPSATWVVLEGGLPDPFQLHWQHLAPAVGMDRFSWSGEASGHSHNDAQSRDWYAIEDLYFHITEGTPFEVRASRGVGGEVLCRLEELAGIGGGTMRVVTTRTLSAQGDYVEKGFLTPGAYRFVSALSLFVPRAVGDVSASGSAGIIIPAPTAAWAVPACLTLAAMRRRRTNTAFE